MKIKEPNSLFTIVNNKDEFIDFVVDKECYFNCPEDYEDFFGFTRNFNRDTGEITESVRDAIVNHGIVIKPESYPTVIYFSKETKHDRAGDTSVLIYEFAGIEE